MWDKGLTERKCRRKRGIEGWDGGRWGLGRVGMGSGWEVKGVKGDWKMGMISDCYQLQENQRKNDPLTVKTPSPLHWFPSCLVDAGRQVAGALSPADPPAASLPSSGPPLLCFPLWGRIQAGPKVPQSLAAQGFRANAEKVQKPAFTAATAWRRWCRWAGSCRPRIWGKGFPWCHPPALLPSCPTPAMHPNAQPVRVLLSDRAGRRSGGAFPFRYRKRMSRNNT